MAKDLVTRVGAAEGLAGAADFSLAAAGAEVISPGAASGQDELNTGLAPPFRALLVAEEPAAQEKPVTLLDGTEAGSSERLHVPGYEILAELGRGGMGVVYLARQCLLKRLVALKMLRTGLDASWTARLRFRIEAEAAARLQHPHIVQIHEVGEHEDRLYLALEYVAGGSLRHRIAGVPQPEQDAARLVEQLARAVHYMHQCGILHRDLKPHNILLTADGTPKITDFGLAKVLDSEGGPSHSEALLGTPNYMAPEQAAGDTKKVGMAADVYSLGAILYELLTGRAPFQGTSLLSILEQVRTQEPVPPRRLRRSLLRDVETICLKCLEKEPEKRYASAEALAGDLRRFRAGQPVQARPVPVWQRAWRSARRHPALAGWTLSVLAVIGLLVTAWLYFRGAKELAHHRAEEKYHQLLQRRDDAFVYGLLAPDDGSLLLGGMSASYNKAERAARQALSLAGVDLESAPASLDASLPSPRHAEITADCYTLLILLAGIRGQQARPGEADRARYQQALRILDRARTLGFQTRAYHLRRAHFLEQLGEVEEARQDREQAASLAPAGVLDHFLAGEEHYRYGRWQPAIRSLSRALSLEPSHFWSRFLLAVCHLKKQQWETAKVGLSACLAQQPDFVWAYLFRGYANEQLQATAEAETDLQKALQLHPNDDARYALLLTRGILHFNQKELKRAEDCFRAAIALKPQQYNAYLSLAQVYLARGALEAAAVQMQTVQKLRPPAPALAGYHLERGRSFLHAQRYAEAIEACATSLKLSPQQSLPHEVRGHALLALQGYEQAEESFNQYLRAGGARTTDLFRGRGQARMQLGKYPEAMDDFTRALELAADGDIYQHRGWAHFFADAWKLAVRDFSKAIEMNPAAGDAYTGRGLALVMLGDYQGAVADAEAALLRRPRTPEMMHNIACIFAQAAACAEAQRPSLAPSYRRRALEAVQQTLALLPIEERAAFWKKKILPDAALMPIHDEKEFQRLAERYGPRR